MKSLNGYLKVEQTDFLSNYVGSFQELRNAGELVNTEEWPMWKCTECGKQFKPKVKSKLEYHVETHLEGFTHTCEQCNKVHKTRYPLQQHISLCHIVVN